MPKTRAETPAKKSAATPKTTTATSNRKATAKAPGADALGGKTAAAARKNAPAAAELAAASEDAPSSSTPAKFARNAASPMKTPAAKARSVASMSRAAGTGTSSRASTPATTKKAPVRNVATPATTSAAKGKSPPLGQKRALSKTASRASTPAKTSTVKGNSPASVKKRKAPGTTSRASTPASTKKGTAKEAAARRSVTPATRPPRNLPGTDDSEHTVPHVQLSSATKPAVHKRKAASSPTYGTDDQTYIDEAEPFISPRKAAAATARRSKSPAKSVLQSIEQHAPAAKSRKRAASRSPSRSPAKSPGRVAKRSASKSPSKQRFAPVMASIENAPVLDPPAASTRRAASPSPSKSPARSPAKNTVRRKKSASRSPARSAGLARGLSKSAALGGSRTKRPVVATSPFESPARRQGQTLRKMEVHVPDEDWHGSEDSFDELVSDHPSHRVNRSPLTHGTRARKRTFRRTLNANDGLLTFPQPARRKSSQTLSPARSRRTSEAASAARHEAGDSDRSTHQAATGARASNSARDVRRASPTNPPINRAGSPSKSRTSPAPTSLANTATRTDPGEDPFYEPLPGKEVWHRRMPPSFPFGETPYMEKVTSDQINAALHRTSAHIEPCTAAANRATGSSDAEQQPKSVAGSFRNLSAQLWDRLAPAPQPLRSHASPWALPHVSAALVDVVLAQQQARQTGAGAAGGGRSAARAPKRKAAALDGRAARRARTDVGELYDEPLMSGALLD